MSYNVDASVSTPILSPSFHSRPEDIEEETAIVKCLVLESGSSQVRDCGIAASADACVPAENDDIDADLVTWDGPEDPANPRNWTKQAKWTVTVLGSLFELVTLTSSLMIAPAFSTVSRDLHIKNDASTQLSLSSCAGFQFGPSRFRPPIRALWPKKYHDVVESVVFDVEHRFWICKKSKRAYCRTLLLWARRQFGFWQRKQSLAVYSFLPLIGPAIGPIVGGFMTQRTTWRWCFWSTSIFDGVLQAAAMFWLWETHGPTVLHKKAKRPRKTTGNVRLHTSIENRSISDVVESLTRAIRFLGCQPIVQLGSIYTAYVFGVMYIVSATFANFWAREYGESIEVSGLNYIALAIGYTVGAQTAGLLTDRVSAHFKSRGNVTPEHRILVIFPAIICIPSGLLWYGWAAKSHLHWIMPNIGASIFGMGTQIGAQSMQAYLIDSYREYTASALAASWVLRSITGFAFPLFGLSLYKSVGYGWGNSILVLGYLIVGFPIPLVIWFYGARLRAKERELVEQEDD
ncbi:MAG: hypothetical protein M1818_005813 [Claussenomyces sp. TS43310]|nr:MAG: hypothetical protein M1818_005813 [Claussenomyces sp. TS43310]